MKQSRTMNYLKKFDSFSYNESVDTKPGEILDLPDIGIKGEVFLTEEIETAYHGGIIDNIDTYLDEYALYLTHKKRGAAAWTLGASRRGWSFTRTYEVKIKKGSKFIEFSPAGIDQAYGLNRIENVLEARIIEPLKIKTQAISSASEVAIMILRIDDVIASVGSRGGHQGMRGMPDLD